MFIIRHTVAILLDWDRLVNGFGFGSVHQTRKNFQELDTQFGGLEGSPGALTFMIMVYKEIFCIFSSKKLICS